MESARDDQAHRDERTTDPATRRATLLYSRVDRGDMLGFTSMLREDIRITFPSHPPAHGRSAAEELARSHLTERGLHLIHRARTEGGNVIVDGSFTDADTRRSTRFTDSLTFSERELVTVWHRAYSSHWMLPD